MLRGWANMSRELQSVLPISLDANYVQEEMVQVAASMLHSVPEEYQKNQQR